MRLVNYYKKNSRKSRKINCGEMLWSLTLDDARLLFFGNCHYCGEPPQTEYKYTGVSPPVILLRNGIDRKDNSIGYILNNCVSCCWWCNRAKGTTPYDEFILRCHKIANHHLKS